MSELVGDLRGGVVEAAASSPAVHDRDLSGLLRALGYSDTVAPVVANVVPPSGLSSLNRGDDVAFDVTDDSGSVTVMLLAVHNQGQPAEVIYDGAAFLGRYLGISTVTPITNGFSFLLLRTHGWPATNLTIRIFAIDPSGNMSVVTSLNYEVLDPDGTAPAFSGFSPAKGGSVATGGTLAFAVDDLTLADLAIVTVKATLPDGSVELVHDGTSFGSSYDDGSSRIPTVTGYTYAVRRDAGWVAPQVALGLYAEDQRANAATDLYGVDVENVGPTVGTFSPANPGSLITTNPASFDVTDATGFGRIIVHVTYSTGLVELIHDGSAYKAPYAAGSTRTPIVDGYHYSIARSDGWAAQGAVIAITAIDALGVESTVSYVLTVTDGPPPDTATPTIANYSPPIGTAIERTDPINFDVTDDSGALVDVIVWVAYRPPFGAELIHDGAAFTTKFASLSLRTPVGLVASVETDNTSPFSLVDGMQLNVEVDGIAQTVTFVAADFDDIGVATAAEIAAVLIAELTDGSAGATSTGTKVTIFSETTGTPSSVEVTGGTANAILGFPTDKVLGTSGWRYRCRRVGGWLDEPTIEVRAFDPSGQEGIS